MQRNRKRRAAPSDIYPACKLSNTCPPDIVNKFEHNTLADKILKYGSAGVFLGSLGIGTGRGGAGTTFGEYVPLGTGSGVRVGTRVTAIRPTVPISSIGPGESIPVDAVNPLGPAIIPLREFPIAVEEPAVILPPKFPSIVEDELPLITEAETSFTSPPSTIPVQTPKITTDDGAAILEVIPETRPPKILTRSQYSNPTFEVSLTTTGGSGESSATDHIFIEGHSGGEVIGEEIPLRQFSLSTSTRSVQETEFLTSTPRPDVEVESTRHYYNRRLQQVQVFDEAFINRPKSLVTFDNPAYTDSVDLIFDQDIIDVAKAAPHEAFKDLVTLSRPYFSRTDQGLRISRFGQHGSIKTRSGLVIGPQTHYYYDVSAISPESIELTPLNNSLVGEQSGESVISTGSDFDVVSLNGSLQAYSDSELLDVYEPVGTDLQLIIGERRNVRPVSVLNSIKPLPGLFGDYNGVLVIHPTEHDSESDFYPIYPEDTPVIVLDWQQSNDFFLHPSLIKKKRRKRSAAFF
ncbi:L2 [Ailuropoda melanoleuca papillomavirus 4]|uniref:Minor capsid protein L2 n=1 Tax=Ailuropoda melanoleuca papillomavirus 4 TaxID=2016453 RepID=A0A220IGF7_9PAPI|nr:L2 [Ailuropoda melanoleuca papillomavirus 4]ASH99074.1 L2 [Ailuropoda melanoleuca papillomavirus 4]